MFCFPMQLNKLSSFRVASDGSYLPIVHFDTLSATHRHLKVCEGFDLL